MSEDFGTQAEKLLVAVTNASTAHGEDLCKREFDAALLLLQWLSHLIDFETTGSGDELISGVSAAVVEAMGSISLGLARPALFAMRGQIDMALSWLYFKDHPIERALLDDTGDGFLLKRDAIEYLEKHYRPFRQRFNRLSTCRLRQDEDPYKLLSAHVHGQSFLVIPSYNDLSTLVCNKQILDQAIIIQSAVAEYISDVFIAIFADKWASLPDEVLAPIYARVGKNTGPIFA